MNFISNMYTSLSHSLYPLTLSEKGNSAKTNTAADQDGIIQSMPTEILLNIFKFLDLNSLMQAKDVCRTWGELAKQQLIDEHLPMLANQAGEFKHRSDQHKKISKTVYNIISVLHSVDVTNEGIKRKLENVFANLVSAMCRGDFDDSLKSELHKFSLKNPDSKILSLWPQMAIGVSSKAFILELNRREEEGTLDIKHFEIYVMNNYLTGNGAPIFFSAISDRLLCKILNEYSNTFLLVDSTVQVFSNLPEEAAYEKMLVLANWYRDNNAQWNNGKKAHQALIILEIADCFIKKEGLEGVQKAFWSETIPNIIHNAYPTWEDFANGLNEGGINSQQCKEQVGKFWH